MKSFERAFIALAASCLILSCNKNEEFSIVGTWEYVSYIKTSEFANSSGVVNDEFYEFKEDGTLIYYEKNKSTIGSYSFNGTLGIMTYELKYGTQTSTIGIINNNEIEWSGYDTFGIVLTTKRLIRKK